MEAYEASKNKNGWHASYDIPDWFPGEEPSANQIRQKLKEVMDGYFTNSPTTNASSNFHSAKSWCKANGGRLIRRSEYSNDLARAMHIIRKGCYGCGSANELIWFDDTWGNECTMKNTQCGSSRRWSIDDASNSFGALCKK